MAKKSNGKSNEFCPQTLFLYGTYKEDGTPNFGLFCWFSYTWNAELGVMACIGGDKLTKTLIRKNKYFSANLVTQSLLSLADYYGNTNGYDKEKMQVCPPYEKGEVLEVPIIMESPVSFELEAVKEIALDGSDVFLCKIHNVMVEETLLDEQIILEERLRKMQPVLTTCQRYFTTSDEIISSWGQPKESINKANVL